MIAGSPLATVRHWWRFRHSLRRRWRTTPLSVRALIWMALGGLFFSLLNALVRQLTLSVDPMQSQFLRYLFGVLVMVPWLWRHGLAAYRPVNLAGQFWRGLVHTLGLVLWFIALPRIPLA
ncbi:MAG: EamA/RhaT family transporter, partial [Limnohabitans sp.]